MEEGNSNLGNGHMCREGETSSHSVSFPEEKAREAVLELDIAVLNSKDGMEKAYEKLDTVFLEDQSTFFGLQNFQRISETT